MAVPQLISWLLPPVEAGWDYVELSTSSTIAGEKTVLATINGTDQDYYWDLTGSASTIYWVRYAKYGTPVTYSNYFGPYYGEWALTSPELVKRSAQLSSNMTIAAYLPQYISEVTSLIVENYGRPCFASTRFTYDNTLDTQEYDLADKDVFIVTRIYKEDLNKRPVAKTDLVEFTDYYIDKRYGKVVLLLPVKDSSSANTTFVVEYIPNIFKTLATAKAAWRALLVASRASGDRETSDLLKEQKNFIEQIESVIKHRYGDSKEFNPLNDPVEAGSFTE